MGLLKRIRELFGAASDEPQPPVEAEARDYTRDELRRFDGTRPNTPVLVALNGEIFDVTSSRHMYGPGGPYGAFAGRDCTAALAKMSFEPEHLDATNVAFSDDEQRQLDEWVDTFRGKYPLLGRLVEARPSKVSQSG